jgi:hypothetical protein
MLAGGITDELQRRAAEHAATYSAKRRLPSDRWHRSTRRLGKGVGVLAAVLVAVYGLSAVQVWSKERNHEYCRGSYAPPVAFCQRPAHQSRAEKEFIEGEAEQEPEYDH